MKKPKMMNKKLILKIKMPNNNIYLKSDLFRLNLKLNLNKVLLVKIKCKK